jgi:hypothetical protein
MSLNANYFPLCFFFQVLCIVLCTTRKIKDVTFYLQGNLKTL